MHLHGYCLACSVDIHSMAAFVCIGFDLDLLAGSLSDASQPRLRPLFLLQS